MVQRYRVESIAPNFAAPLLSSESKEEFEALRLRFREDIKPRNFIERMYCDDVANLVWEMARFRRAKVGILNLAWRHAMYDILVEDLAELEGGEETVDYLDRWFRDPVVKQEVRSMLVKYNLDESAIEAKAFCECPLSLGQMEQSLAMLESRRDKALYNIAVYRKEFAEELRSKVTEVIRGEKVAVLAPPKQTSRG